jgi:hypothetical protein
MTIEVYTYDAESPESVDTYHVLKSWSDDTFPPPYLLPKLGVIVRAEGEAVAFVCADMSNSIPRAYIDFLQTNPDVGAITRFKAVKLAEKFLCQELKRLGYGVIVGMTQKAGIAFLSQRLGYWLNPKGMTYLAKTI